MVFTSKTIIPGKEPIGRNKDGSYIYNGVQAPNMSVMPSQGTYDTGKQMSVVPKVWTPPTPVPMVKSPVGFNIMPKVDPVIAAKVNAPIEDIKGILQVDKADPRIQKLEQHFKTLKQKGGLQLNQKQTEYVQRYKKNLPQYANVPDALLFGRIIMKYPEAQEKYGNIGEKSLLKRIVGLPLDIAKTGSDAIMEAQNVFDERQQTLNKDGNPGITSLLASAAAGRALGGGVLGMAGDVLNVASPLINPETGVTTITEGLGRDIGTGIEKVPEEYRQEISDLIVKYPKISATLGTAGDLSNLIPFLGVLGKVKSASQVDDILRQVKTRPATKFRGPVSQEVFDAGMNRSVIKDAASVPVKTSAATLRGTAKAGEFTGETAISTAVGLSKPSQQAIKTTPELYKQARTGVLTRDTAADEVVTTLRKRLGELSDTGKEYNTIRNSGVTMPKQDFAKIVDDFFKENDISKIDMPIKDRKVVQQAIDYIAEYDDILTAKNGMSLRRKLDDLADWSTEATGEGKRLIRKLRGKVDEYLGEKLPGLKDLDAKYAPEVSFLRKVKTGVLNADGTIKDSAISYVANIVGKGKEIKLDRLEQLLPGIGSKVRALKAFEEVQAISSMKTGSIARQLGGIVTGSTLGGPIGLVAGFVATNPNIVAFALEKYGMAKNAIKALLKKGAKITPDEAIKVKQAVDATPKEAIATYLLGAGEQRKLLMPPKAGDSIIKRISEGKSPTPSSNSPSVSSVESSKQKLLPVPQKPQVESGISSVLSQLSKEKSKSAGKKVNNSIIEKLAKKQETPKTSNIDPELESLQKQYETLPGVPKVEVPADYIPKDGLPTGTEFEAPIISSISKTKGKLPSPDVKRPQIRGFDLSTRSSMLESLKEQGMFTDSFFVVKDKNVSNKLFEYAEKKAIKKGNPTSGTKVDMKALVERAENGADTLLTPKEYMKLGKENGVYLRMDIGNGNQVAVNASYADIFFKNFDDVTFKGNNELSPVVVLSKGEPVGVIMPIKDVYSLKGKLGDFSMQSKTPQVEGKTVEKSIISFKEGNVDDVDVSNLEQYIRDKSGKKDLIFDGYDDDFVMFKKKGEKLDFKVSNNTYDYKINLNTGEAINRSDEIKKLAREARSSKEEVILDLTKEPTPKAKVGRITGDKEIIDFIEKTPNVGFYAVGGGDIVKYLKDPEAYIKKFADDPEWIAKVERAVSKIKESGLPKTPQVEGKTVDKIKAMQLEQEDMIRKGESISDDFRTKWNDLQSQYKKEFIDSKIASEKKKVDSAISEIKSKAKSNPDRTDWAKNQIEMEEKGFNALKKGDYFEKKYQEHIKTIREEAKKSSLLKSIKDKPKPSLPLSQKSEVKYSKPDLASEAKKYKSAEEFVKAQGEPVYHGTAKDFTEFKMSESGTRSYEDWGRGIYLTPSEESAGMYARESAQRSDSALQEMYKKLQDIPSSLPGKNQYGMPNPNPTYDKALKAYQDAASSSYKTNKGGKTMQVYIDEGAKRGTHVVSQGGAVNPTIADKYREKGFDIVDIKAPNGEIQEIVVLNPDVIKTRQQLLDIYNKANKK